MVSVYGKLRMQHFHSTMFNTVKFNMLWQSNSVEHHPTSLTIIQHDYHRSTLFYMVARRLSQVEFKHGERCWTEMLYQFVWELRIVISNTNN